MASPDWNGGHALYCLRGCLRSDTCRRRGSHQRSVSNQPAVDGQIKRKRQQQNSKRIHVATIPSIVILCAPMISTSATMKATSQNPCDCNMFEIDDGISFAP